MQELFREIVSKIYRILLVIFTKLFKKKIEGCRKLAVCFYLMQIIQSFRGRYKTKNDVAA